MEPGMVIQENEHNENVGDGREGRRRERGIGVGPTVSLGQLYSVYHMSPIQKCDQTWWTH